MRIEQLSCHIGAELCGVSLRDAAHDDGLFSEIYAALLRHRVLFLRDQNITRQDHVAFVSRMGELEDHPLLPSPADAPGLVQLCKGPDKRPERYENIWHSDNTWRRIPSKACVLRCVECPPVGGDTMWANMVAANVRCGQDYNRGGAELLQYLISQACVPEYQVRWRWKPDSVAIWDNRSTQHYAVMDYPPAWRRMDRASVVGEQPF